MAKSDAVRVHRGPFGWRMDRMQVDKVHAVHAHLGPCTARTVLNNIFIESASKFISVDRLDSSWLQPAELPTPMINNTNKTSRIGLVPLTICWMIHFPQRQTIQSIKAPRSSRAILALTNSLHPVISLQQLGHTRSSLLSKVSKSTRNRENQPIDLRKTALKRQCTSDIHLPCDVDRSNVYWPVGRQEPCCKANVSSYVPHSQTNSFTRNTPHPHENIFVRKNIAQIHGSHDCWEEHGKATRSSSLRHLQSGCNAKTKWAAKHAVLVYPRGMYWTDSLVSWPPGLGWKSDEIINLPASTFLVATLNKTISAACYLDVVVNQLVECMRWLSIMLCIDRPGGL